MSNDNKMFSTKSWQFNRSFSYYKDLSKLRESIPVRSLLNKETNRIPCAVSGQKSIVKNAASGVAFASQELHDMWWSAIGESIIYELVGIKNLKEDQPTTLDERQNKSNNITSSIKYTVSQCTDIARKQLQEGKLHLSIISSLQALNLAREIYSEDHTELISIYICLTEANLGLRRVQECSAYLVLANMCIVRSKEKDESPPPTSVISSLHISLGRLFAGQNKIEQALLAFSRNVLILSKLYGPKSIFLTEGIFYLAKSFSLANYQSKASDIFDQILDIVLTYLSNPYCNNRLNRSRNLALLSVKSDYCQNGINLMQKDINEILCLYSSEDILEILSKRAADRKKIQLAYEIRDTTDNGTNLIKPLTVVCH